MNESNNRIMMHIIRILHVFGQFAFTFYSKNVAILIACAILLLLRWQWLNFFFFTSLSLSLSRLKLPLVTSSNAQPNAKYEQEETRTRIKTLCKYSTHSPRISLFIKRMNHRAWQVYFQRFDMIFLTTIKDKYKYFVVKHCQRFLTKQTTKRCINILSLI